jgi:hypothetical protein
MLAAAAARVRTPQCGLAFVRGLIRTVTTSPSTDMILPS